MGYRHRRRPRRRRDLALADRQATIHFLPRDIERIDVERITTDMGPCLVTTPEQTALDLAHLPKLGDMEFDAWSAIDALLPRCDNEVLDRLRRRAAAQRRASPPFYPSARTCDRVSAATEPSEQR